jgi:1-deoxy-D-xylulose-5-phosphate synthase
MAAGMAKAGLKPIVSIYSTFLQRAMDQVIHDVAIMNLPVVFGIDRGGLVEDGETHQGVFDIAFLRSIPNFTVLAPMDAPELRNMLYTVIRDCPGPVAIRFPRDEAFDADAIEAAAGAFETVDFHHWKVVSPQTPSSSEPGSKKVVLLAYGAMVKAALDAGEHLRQHQIDATIINARSVKPLDTAVLRKVLENTSNKVVTLEEGCRSGGFGAAVLEFRSSLHQENPGKALAEVVLMGVPDRFIEHGSRSILVGEVGLSAKGVTDFVTEYLNAR